MANLKVLIESVDSDSLVQTRVDSQKPAAGSNMPTLLIQIMQELQLGRKKGSVMRFSACDTKASTFATLASVVADDEFNIGILTFTAKASPSSTTEFLVGGTDTDTAVNLAAKINAHPDLVNWLVASSALAVVTLTCLVPGQIGNYILVGGSSTFTFDNPALENGADANNSSETM